MYNTCRHVLFYVTIIVEIQNGHDKLVLFFFFLIHESWPKSNILGRLKDLRSFYFTKNRRIPL